MYRPLRRKSIYLRMMRKWILLCQLLIVMALPAMARDYYAEAEELYYAGRFSEAIKLALEGVAVPDIGEEDTIELYSILGSSYARLGSFGKAAEYMVKCYEYDKANGEVKGLTSSLINLASMYVYAGEPELAEDYIKEAILNEYEIGRKDKLAMVHGKACDVYHAMGRDSLALEHADIAVAIATKDLDKKAEAIRRSQRAYPLESLGRYREALQDLRFAESVFREADMKQSLSIVCFQLGQEYGREGRTTLERQYLREAADLARDMDDLPLLQKVYSKLAESLKDSNPSAAYDYMKQSSSLQDSISRSKSDHALELFNIEYETARREKTIAEQNLELMRQKRHRSVLAIIILALLAGAIVTLFLAIKTRRSERKLKASNDQKDFLFKVISHDIHSPAVAQLRGIQMIRANAGKLSESQIKKVLLQLERQAESEVELIDNVLRWARSKSGSENGESVRFVLAELVKEAISQYKGASDVKGIRLELKEKDEGIVVCTIRSNIMISLRNLLSNAIKFSESGSPVEICLSKTEDGAEISVTDHGVGIPADKMAAIFESGTSFRRLGTDGEPSNGLGLAVSRALMEETGGSLSVQCGEKQGSTFTIHIHNSSDNV